MRELLTVHRGKVLSLLSADQTIEIDSSYNIPGATLYRVYSGHKWAHCYRELADGTLWQVEVNGDPWTKVPLGEDLFS